MATDELTLSMQIPAPAMQPSSAPAQPVELRIIDPEDYVIREADGRIRMVYREWEYDGAELLTHADGWAVDFAGGATNYPLVARCACGALHVEHTPGRWVEPGAECESERYAELVKRPIDDVQRCIEIKR